MKGQGMDDAREITDGVTAALDRQLMERVRRTIADHRARVVSGDELGLADLCDALERTGFTIPILICEGWDAERDADCNQLRYHHGNCRA